MELPAVVARVVDAYLEAVDLEAAGLVEGLYLEGSVALDDFRPRTSDVDFVAVTAARVDKRGLAALERAHARLRDRWARPCFDGIYVTWDDLRHDPTGLRPCASSHEGRFHVPDESGVASPVTWHTLARHGVACRGPEPSDLNVWADTEVLAAWIDGNLDHYWRRLLERAGRLSSPWGLATLTAYGAVWVVTGVGRLHYTLATGGIASKELAALYALETFPQQWRRVICESLRIRRADRARPTLSSSVVGCGEFLCIGQAGQHRSVYRTPLARRRDVLAFGDIVVDDAHRLYAER
jgi:hypothetical protein